MRWLRHSRLSIIALVSFLAVAGGAIFKKSIALSLCGILSFNSLACNAYLSDSSRANAASPSSINEIEQPTTDSSQEHKVADVCVFGVCAPINLPKPIENVIQGGLDNAAKDKLRSLLADEIPISGSDHKFYPSVATLSGKPFTPQTLYLTDLSPNTPIPAGDYEIPVHFYCTGIYSFNGRGNRFALAQLKGRMADALSALYARTSYDSSTSINDIQTLAWAMQSGMAYNELSAPHKALVDRYIPEYRDSMQRSFVDRLTGISNQVSRLSGGRVPDITKVLNTLGPVGDVAQSLLRAREQILRTNYSHQPLAQEFAPQKNFSLEGGVEKTPWSQVQENVYMRSIAPNGAMHDGTVQVRILNNGTRAADGSYQVAQATPLLAAPASTGTITSEALLTHITKSVAVSEASHGQAAQAAISLAGKSTAYKPKCQLLVNSVLFSQKLENPQEIEELYVQLLGVTARLDEYRQRFLKNDHDFINLFPLAYYNTTMEELKRIKQGEFSHPREKMEQMLSFFDAYEDNRQQWDLGNKSAVEPHWAAHFEIAIAKQGFFRPYGRSVEAVLGSGIDAHVSHDLARAIRYTLRQQAERGVFAENLVGDFDKTNETLRASGELTKKEVFSFIPREVIVPIADYLTGTSESVLQKRKKAWEDAVGGRELKPSKVGERDIKVLNQNQPPPVNRDSLKNSGASRCLGSVP